MDFITTGLGAGSYPEPPPGYRSFEDNDRYPYCEVCGGDYTERELTYFDGKKLCPLCRQDAIIAKSTTEEQQWFVDDNYELRKNFYLKFLFEQSDEFGQINLVRDNFLSPSRYNGQQLRKEALLDYVKQNPEAFVAFRQKDGIKC